MRNFDLFVASSRFECWGVFTKLDHYLEECPVPRKDDFVILSWWKSAIKFALLELIARGILGIPLSSMALDSVFSTRGRFVSPNHIRLHLDEVEALRYTQNWILASTISMKIEYIYIYMFNSSVYVHRYTIH